MEIGCIPHEALVSFLIFFFFLALFTLISGARSQLVCGASFPIKPVPFLKASSYFNNFLIPLPSWFLSSFHIALFWVFKEKKKNYYFRASAHTILPACSSPSLQLSKFIFPEKAFSSLYLNKRPPPIYFMTLNTVLHFVLFMFFFLYCQTSPSSSIKAVTWCDLFIIAPSSPV